MPRTKTENKKYLRQWRKNNQNEKRFSKPLRQFMQVKYRDEYNEYCHFFKTLNEKHPEAKDLTKTSTYKKWKSRQLNCEDTDEETNGETPEIPPPEDVELPVAVQGVQPLEIPPPEDVELPVAVQDYLDVVVQEVQPLGNVEINHVDNQIQQIIDELEQNDVIRGVLNDVELGLFNEVQDDDDEVQDDDEGIALDIETELNDIVEPFNYELEVRDVDFF